MSNFQLDGADYSANAPAIPGTLSLLNTIPANKSRRGYIIQNQDGTDNVYAVFDDKAGALTATVIILAPGAAAGSQGGSIALAGMPHTGRIRIYGANATTKMGARAW